MENFNGQIDVENFLNELRTEDSPMLPARDIQWVQNIQLDLLTPAQREFAMEVNPTDNMDEELNSIFESNLAAIDNHVDQDEEINPEIEAIMADLMNIGEERANQDAENFFNNLYEGEDLFENIDAPEAPASNQQEETISENGSVGSNREYILADEQTRRRRGFEIFCKLALFTINPNMSNYKVEEFTKFFYRALNTVNIDTKFFVQNE